ncbi:hypothetical protein PR202_ga10124 [Eleusine coracana subsp. coracana]|uniref:Uncharacterized protein n=1 Tax=Eleusine coracana subsp. coracana TaxID=191504 RepID=A0AAV5C5Y1_ELECO|nr:hypothetical protein PR202_ga10124 [Eleusine coracana subsp. coracana]
MENLISLVNKLQRACTALGDHGEGSTLPTLWDSLPVIAVVGGQSSGKSSVLESVVGKDFLPRGSGISQGAPWFCNYTELMVKENTQNSCTLRIKDSQILVTSLLIYSFVALPNCIILAISPANQDLATSDAIKISREVDPKGERTFGVLTKIDLMDKGTYAVDILEGRSYRLPHPWIGVVNRSQQDINKNVDMIAARLREREYFASTPQYKHLTDRMGSEHLAKILSKHLENVIKSRIPGLQSLITKTTAELETELHCLGKPIAADAGVRLLPVVYLRIGTRFYNLTICMHVFSYKSQDMHFMGKLYTIMEICRMFDGIYKEHLDGARPGGEKIYYIFDNQFPVALKRLQFEKHLSMENVKKLVTQADGYQPHLIAPEQGYRRLIESCLVSIRGPAEATIDAVHGILKELVHKSIKETHELKQFPTLRVEVSNAAFKSLDRMRDESKKNTLKLVDMECDYLTVDFFRKLPQDVEKGGNATHSIFDRYTDSYLKRIGTNVLAYVDMLFPVQTKQLSKLLDEDPEVMDRRANLAKRLELYRSAQAEIDAVEWAK